MAQESTRKNPPVDTIRFGGCKASIFENKLENSPVPVYKMGKPVRTYTLKGEFKTVETYREEDIPCLIVTLFNTWLRMHELRKKAWDDSRTESSAADEAEADDES